MPCVSELGCAHSAFAPLPGADAGAFSESGVRGEPTWQLHVRGFNRAFALLLDFYAGEALGVVP